MPGIVDNSLGLKRHSSSFLKVVTVLSLVGALQLVFFGFGRWYLGSKSSHYLCGTGSYCDVLRDSRNVYRQIRVRAEVLKQLESIQEQLVRRKNGSLYTYSIHRHLMDLRKYLSGSEGPLRHDNQWMSTTSCHQVFLGGRIDGERYLHNWKNVNCNFDEESVYGLISFCFFVQSNQNNTKILEAIQTLVQKHSRAHVLLGVRGEFIHPLFKSENIHLHHYPATTADGAIWNSLFNKVSRPYTFVARDVGEFDVYSTFVRPVMLMDNYKEVGVTTFALRAPDGVWSLNCYQVLVRQSEIVVEEGYNRSFNESLLCDYGSGPFLAQTTVLKTTAMDESLEHSTALFLDYFLRLREVGVVVLDTPDFMAMSTKANHSLETSKSLWLKFAVKWKISSFSIIGKKSSYSCQEINVHCKDIHQEENDFPVSLCCWEEVKKMLNRAVKFMNKHDVDCEADSVPLRAVTNLGRGHPIDLKAIIHCKGSGMEVFKNNKDELRKGDDDMNYMESGNTIILSHKTFPDIKITVQKAHQESGKALPLSNSVPKRRAEKILQRIREDHME